MNKRQEIYKITSIVLIIDQFIKLIIKNNIKLENQIEIIPKFFSIYYVENTGAAFSILSNNTTLLIIISVVIILLLDNLIKKEKTFNNLATFSLGIIIGGIFGNLIDRILYRAVIDYLSFTILNYNFPIFNLADIGITIGVILLIISMLKKDKVGKNGSSR